MCLGEWPSSLSPNIPKCCWVIRNHPQLSCLRVWVKAMLSHPFTPSTTGVPLSFDYSIHSLLHSKLNTNFALIFFFRAESTKKSKNNSCSKGAHSTAWEFYRKERRHRPPTCCWWGSMRVWEGAPSRLEVRLGLEFVAASVSRNFLL